MIGLPKIGEKVTFCAAEGHRVPVAHRVLASVAARQSNPKVKPPASADQFYVPGQPVTEEWTYLHHTRLLSGALVLMDWSGKPEGAQ